MALIVRGFLDKQIGFKLGTGEIAVKAHRGQVMRKMNVTFSAERVNAADLLDVDLSQGSY
ncbi:LuxR C-terminal-related transcriptional regulator [Bradyrhizobium lablabi]|uniref:LuxR C-terminal-related transcriptional regulator n=1 Tax=Bradyrhizobium lablabi TaxID=722472 RepID=UPI002010F1D9|nr:LuxR C-terminal-related transcriptional regulator [Bradyrhizobium lablabi]